MERLIDVQDFVKKTLGDEASDVLGRSLEDLFYRIRSWALLDSKSQIEKVRERINKMAIGVVMEAIKVYLAKNYADRWSVSDDDDVIDDNMSSIRQIEIVKKYRDSMIEIIEREALKEFSRGRDLANIVVSRAREYILRQENGEPSPKDPNWDYFAVPPKPPRDYADNPAAELTEVEIMRLERKLPGLSEDEGKRLKELYNKCAGK